MTDITTPPCQAPVVVPDSQPKTVASAASKPTDDAARVKAVAAQFESILLTQMLQQMRHSVYDDGSDDEKSGTAPLADSMYSELGLALSRAGGFGLADALSGALMKRAGISPTGAAASGALGTTGQLQTGIGGLPLSLPGGIALPPGMQGLALPDRASFGIPLPLNLMQQLTASAIDVPATVSSIPAPPAAVVPMPDAPAAAVAAAAPSPVSGPVSSAYGWRKDPIDGQAKFHAGTDVPMPVGSDVHAASDGRVTFVGEKGGYGLTVEVTHANGLVTRYAHLSSSAVQPGDVVSAGQVIAASGNSGRSTGPHLHFEVMENGQPIDPQGAGAARLAELRRQSSD